MSSMSDISDLASSSILNISKVDIVNTSIILKNPEPVEYCLSKFNFEASKNDELSFKADQYIRVIKKVDGGWWEGKLDERIGWFPTDFVSFEIEPQKLQELAKNDKPLTTEEISILKYKNIVFNRSQLQLSDLGHVEIEISESEFIRNEITKDLIHSEEAYIEDINNFTNQIIKPLENETWISYADRNDMFGRIPWLSNLHVCLTSELKSALNQPEEKNIGNCFNCVVQNFEIVYSDYFTSCPRAIYVASQYSTNNHMTTFLVNAGCQSLPPILHILSFLHKPIQRMTKYSPVLSEILHFTKPEDPGFDELVNMVTKFKQLEVYLKSLKESAEKKEKLKNLYSSIEDWVGPGIENYGELLLESKVLLLDPSSNTTAKTHFIYLLEKLFVVLKPLTKTENTKYSLVASIPVWKGTLNIVNDVSDLNSFQVIFLPSEQSNKLKTMNITVSKPDIKKQWIETVKRQLEKNVRLTLPSLPQEIQDDLSNDNQSKKKWKKLVPKFARTKGKNENTLPPYTSSNLLLKTSEGGTLISSTLSNLEHKMITEEKRKQGELLKMKYQEMEKNGINETNGETIGDVEKNEEKQESLAMADYSSGVTTQGYNTPIYDNLPYYSVMSRSSVSSSSTCSSASSKMTTICTKCNVVERNAYNYDNTSSYSEGTVYTGINNNIGSNLQMTKIAYEEESNDEFDMMMGNSSSEEEEEEEENNTNVSTNIKNDDENNNSNNNDNNNNDNNNNDNNNNNNNDHIDDNVNCNDGNSTINGSNSIINSSSNERISAVPTFSDSFKEEVSELNKPEKICIEDSIVLENEKHLLNHPNIGDNNSLTEEAEQSQTYINSHLSNANIILDDQLPPLDSTTTTPIINNTAIVNSEIKNVVEANDDSNEINGKEFDVLNQNVELKPDEEQKIELHKKDSFDTFISDEMKSYDTCSIRKVKSTTWYTEDSKSESEELKHRIHDKDYLHDHCKEDIHRDHNVNILLELEELQKRNDIRKNEISEISSIASLKSIQMYSKHPSGMDHHDQYLKQEDTYSLEMVKENISEEYQDQDQDQDQEELPPHPNLIYKNENIVKEDLSTLITGNDFEILHETLENKSSSSSSEPLVNIEQKEINLEKENINEIVNEHVNVNVKENENENENVNVNINVNENENENKNVNENVNVNINENENENKNKNAIVNENININENENVNSNKDVNRINNENIIEQLNKENDSVIEQENNINDKEEMNSNSCIESEKNKDKDKDKEKEEKEKENAILNKIIEKKIAEEIKDKISDISNKDLTIKIRINEEDNNNDINIEIKINRNTEDKVPEVIIESNDNVKTIDVNSHETQNLQEEELTVKDSKKDLDENLEPLKQMEQQESQTETPTQDQVQLEKQKQEDQCIDDSKELIKNNELKEEEEELPQSQPQSQLQTQIQTQTQPQPQPQSQSQSQSQPQSQPQSQSPSQSLNELNINMNNNNNDSSMIEEKKEKVKTNLSVDTEDVLQKENESKKDNNKINSILTIVSSPSTIATQTTDATISVMNEEDKYQGKYHNNSIDSIESKTTLSNSCLPNIISSSLIKDVDSSIDQTLINKNERSNDEHNYEHHLSAVSEMKKCKSPLLTGFSPVITPIISTTTAAATPNDNKENIVEYGLLEKQFKLFMNKSQFYMNEKSNFDRYSDSFIHYQTMNYKDERKSIDSSSNNNNIDDDNNNEIKEQETEVSIENQTENTTILTEEGEKEEKEEGEENENENENKSSDDEKTIELTLLKKRNPKSNLQNKNSDVTVQRSMSESYKPINLYPRPPRKESIHHATVTKTISN